MPIVSIDQLQQAQLDYLIVGGGTSGLTLAARLTENENITVGVVEAGGNHLDADEINIPGYLGRTIANPKFDWTFFTVPQKHAGGQPVLVPRGKGLGGSSAINFMGMFRPSKEEVDALERLGNPGWNWESMLPYFKKCETAFPRAYSDSVASKYAVQNPNPEWHGESGPIKIAMPAIIPDIHGIFLDSAAALGVQKNPDMADGTNTGALTCYFSVDPRTAKRSYAASEYYAPNASRPNLLVVTNAQVTKVLLSATHSGLQRATGIEVTCDGVKHTIKGVKKDIVLSAGSYQTPQVLELSGIGNPKIISAHGIKPIIDLPGVGENLQDHVSIRSIVEVDESLETFDVLGDPKELEKHLALYKEQKGYMASLAAPGCLFISAQQLGIKDDRALWGKMNDGFVVKDIPADDPTLRSGLEKQYKLQHEWLGVDHLSQAEIIDFLAFQPGLPNASPVAGKRYATIVGVVMRPLSRGSVHILSADPLAAPAIDPNFFSNETDLLLLVESLKFCTKIIATPPLSQSVRSYVLPEPGVLAPGEGLEDRLRQYVKENIAPVYHPIGTAAMLPLKDGGVVDSTLKVYGTENLRVVDVSILPMVVATHTQSLAYAIAEKAADLFEKR